MQRVSEHISFNEAIRSQTAIKHNIDNTPNYEQFENMRLIAVLVFEIIRKHFNTAIYISSFFRSEKLNEKIGGSLSSQHLAINGAAIDIDADIFGNVTNKQIFDYINENLEFDQLIWEFGNNKQPNWVHVSYRKDDNRKEVIKSYYDKTGKVKYKLI